MAVQKNNEIDLRPHQLEDIGRDLVVRFVSSGPLHEFFHLRDCRPTAFARGLRIVRPSPIARACSERGKQARSIRRGAQH